ncbi:MAG: 4Fe-4S dicluster domain-containing protein, partial [Planctomycetia bacterium]
MSIAAVTKPKGSHPAGDPLIAALLSEQRDLTAVERFSRRHAELQSPAAAPLYRDLIPLTHPGPGEQYAFEVDLDACSGCKACVAACHSQNGLDEDETWRSVGLLVGGTSALPVLQHVTTACHHCLEPACSIGCPVNAYEKDPVTGIVRHLDDQCIGCQYCTLACPYEVPKYNHGKGIVRKCDMCRDRLAADEAPACVQACPNQAIRITLTSVDVVRRDAEATVFLPGAADPGLTLPTTVFKTKKPTPRNLLPADYWDVRLQHGHPSLSAMLVLTQASVGAFAAQVFTAGAAPRHALVGSLTALALGVVGLVAATSHLG